MKKWATFSFNKAKSYLYNTQKEKGSWKTIEFLPHLEGGAADFCCVKYRPIFLSLPVPSREVGTFR